MTELSDSEEAGPELPLVPEEAGRVSLQEATGEAEGSTQSLPNLREGGFHHGRNCEETTGNAVTVTAPPGGGNVLPFQSLRICQEISGLAR